MATVLLITGAPATGKTTLAKALSIRLKLPHLSKDMYKEQLFNYFPYDTRERGRQLSDASYALLASTSVEMMRSLVSHIVDINYDAQRASFLNFDSTSNTEPIIFNIHLICDYRILKNRFCHRAESTNRDSRHNDLLFLNSVEKYFLDQSPPALRSIKESLVISTEDLSAIEIDGIASAITPFL